MKKSLPSVMLLSVLGLLMAATSGRLNLSLAQFPTSTPPSIIDIAGLLTSAAQTAAVAPTPPPDQTVDAALTAMSEQRAGTRPPNAYSTIVTPLPAGTYLPRDTATP